MPKFSYRARDMQGLLVTGNYDADNLLEMERYLTDHGLIPIGVKESTSGFDLNTFKEFFKKKVGIEELLVVTRQFYTLFKAGMSMEGILSTLAKQTPDKVLADVLHRIKSRISSGDSLSKAFSAHKDVFGELYVSMLAAGEEAGILELVLSHVGELLEKEMETKSAIKSAMMYPKIVIFVLIGAAGVIMTFVVPKFAGFFANFGADLPLPTRILMGSSNFFRGYWYILFAGFITASYFYKRYSMTTRGQFKLGQIAFKLPVFGKLNLKVANARFCHILSALYRSGMSMTRALEITGKTIGNGAFMREVEILKDEVTKGRSISEGMAQCLYFTPIIVDATAVGEKTGALDEMLESMGKHYDVEVKHTIKNLTTLLEPILLGLIFGMVTVFALAIFLPMWGLSSIVNKH